MMPKWKKNTIVVAATVSAVSLGYLLFRRANAETTDLETDWEIDPKLRGNNSTSKSVGTVASKRSNSNSVESSTKTVPAKAAATSDAEEAATEKTAAKKAAAENPAAEKAAAEKAAAEKAAAEKAAAEKAAAEKAAAEKAAAEKAAAEKAAAEKAAAEKAAAAQKAAEKAAAEKAAAEKAAAEKAAAEKAAAEKAAAEKAAAEKAAAEKAAAEKAAEKAAAEKAAAEKAAAEKAAAEKAAALRAATEKVDKPTTDAAKKKKKKCKQVSDDLPPVTSEVPLAATDVRSGVTPPRSSTPVKRRPVTGATPKSSGRCESNAERIIMFGMSLPSMSKLLYTADSSVSAMTQVHRCIHPKGGSITIVVESLDMLEGPVDVDVFEHSCLRAIEGQLANGTVAVKLRESGATVVKTVFQRYVELRVGARTVHLFLHVVNRFGFCLQMDEGQQGASEELKAALYAMAEGARLITEDLEELEPTGSVRHFIQSPNAIQTTAVTIPISYTAAARGPNEFVISHRYSRFKFELSSRRSELSEDLVKDKLFVTSLAPTSEEQVAAMEYLPPIVVQQVPLGTYLSIFSSPVLSFPILPATEYETILSEHRFGGQLFTMLVKNLVTSSSSMSSVHEVVISVVGLNNESDVIADLSTAVSEGKANFEVQTVAGRKVVSVWGPSANSEGRLYVCSDCIQFGQAADEWILFEWVIEGNELPQRLLSYRNVIMQNVRVFI